MPVAPFLFLFRFVCVSVWILLGLLTELVVFPLLGRVRRRRVVGAWSRGLMRLCGVRVRRLGDPVTRGAVLWVANHVSWVDIFVFNSVRTTSFVAKSDIRRWPVIGLLVAWAGTLFIDRRHRHAVRDAGRQIRACFDQGDAVGLFPEGTTTDGSDGNEVLSSEKIRASHACKVSLARGSDRMDAHSTQTAGRGDRPSLPQSCPRPIPLPSPCP